ncbi:MAG: hypothetical protein HYZ19_04500 [Rhodocyclales bacterium]|nr:hypothetical protein [Rhodocyclales bacterium]
MPSKAKPATPPPAKRKRGAAPQPEPNKLIQPELRWRRAQRYAWDRGGAKGGRR